VSSLQPLATRINGASVDLSPRVIRSATVAGSPAAAAETVICTITLPSVVVINYGVILIGTAAWTAGTDGTTFNLKLRQTDTSGTTLIASGLEDLAATKLASRTLTAVDLSPSQPGQVYVMTLTTTLGSATSTVSAASLTAIVI